jgi:hypothetical protein
MERQFNNGDFEKLLRDNANQYRMYPSEKVWKGIHSTLHTRRRWYGLTAAIIFLLTGSVVSGIVFSDKQGKSNLAEQKITPVQTNAQKQISAGENKVADYSKKFTPAIKPAKPADRRAVYITESTSDGPVFNLPSDDDQTTASLGNSNRIGNEELIQTGTPDKTDVSGEEQLLINLGILKNNNKVSTEGTFHNDLYAEKRNIEEESPVNNDTEKDINNEISALASQTIPFIRSKKQAKVTAQVYFTPTVSYRTLTENKNVYNNIGFYVPVIDLDHLVKHKPAMGLEFGIEGRYRVTENFFIKTGFQFNINRYDIRAYSHPTEIATVALNSGYGFDSLASLSNYRNFSGNSPNSNWLENFYFQAAIPVGAELILSNKKNFQWGISGTIQPTYVIGDRAYVISSDYKNYAKFPDLMRRWNLSTGIGTFISYSTGKIKWQVGPHVRYQHLSSFVSELTVKEKLFSAGLKVGATLNKQ